MNTFLGIVIVILAGLSVGASPWPIKCMRRFQFEHWSFIAMFVGLVGTWAVTLLACPDAIGAYQSVGWGVLAKSNLFSLSWGVANVLFMFCVARIGVSLAMGILSGIGVSVGVLIPMVFKGSGAFQNAADLWSRTGAIVVAGVVVMVLGVTLLSTAGLLREQKGESQQPSRAFRVGLLLIDLGGVLSAGISFAFVYSQDPIITAMKARGASDIPANVAVWAAGLFAGVLINVLWPAWLMTRNKSWAVLFEAPGEIPLAAIFGLMLFTGFGLMGKGMLLLGALGASVGFGIQQSMQVLGSQAVGLIAGEWRGAGRKVITIFVLAIVALLLATAIMSIGNATV
jgi:L-rhamnose-H+ transport protein